MVLKRLDFFLNSVRSVPLKFISIFFDLWQIVSLRSDDFKNDPGYIKAFKQNDEGGVVNDSNLRMTVGDPTCVQGGYVTK